MSRMNLNLVAILLLGTLLFLQYRLWFESGGIKEMMMLKKTLAHQATENDKLKKQNEELWFQIQHLKNSEEAFESRARNELGMIRKDETFYQIIKPAGEKNENSDQQ